MAAKTVKLEVVTKAPTDYEGLKAAIASRYASLSRQLQQIARFALENPNVVALETVTTIANRAEVQPSSMVRFAQTMGYDGFSTMQAIFRSRLMEGAVSYRDRIKTINEEHADGSGGTLLEDFTNEGIESLEILGNSVAMDSVKAAAKLIADCDEVFLLAQNRAFPVAFYLGYALGRLEKRYRLLDGVGGLLHQQAAQAKSSDAILAISFEPYSQQVIDIAAHKKEDGVPVIAITDSPLSPLALSGDVVFDVPSQEERAFRSLVAPMCLAQTLIVTLGQEMAERNGDGGNKS